MVCFPNVYNSIEPYFISKLSTNLTCGSYDWSSSRITSQAVLRLLTDKFMIVILTVCIMFLPVIQDKRRGGSNL